jgi:ribosomal protein S18 acetylase RimI-like enzyme
VTVRQLRREDVGRSTEIHLEVLDTEFLAECGRPFLRRYHRAWIESADGIALAAVDGRGQVVGVLLGSMRPDGHYRAMVRRHGAQLSLLLLTHALTRPRFARELIATRGARYLRGLWGMLSAALRDRAGGRPGPSPAPGDTGAAGAAGAAGADADRPLERRVGEITHVMVSSDAMGGGVGRAMVAAAQNLAEQAKLDELVLVTLPHLPAVAFYEHLGWQRVGERTSRSGEQFVQYHLPLKANGRGGSSAGAYSGDPSPE